MVIAMHSELPRNVALFLTCVVSTFSSATGEAVVRTLGRRGVKTALLSDQGCCGQPAWNAGHPEEARRVALPTLIMLEQAIRNGSEAIVCPAGSCTTMCRAAWPEMFEIAGYPDEAERARQIGNFVVEYSELVHRLPNVPRLPDRRRVALHHSCHMLRELGIERQPQDLVERAGCQIVNWPGADRCCGFGGTFSVSLPELSVAMADDKLKELDDNPPDLIVGCDTSCLLQLETVAEARKEPLKTVHVAELLDQAEIDLEKDHGD